ncbi:MAG: methylated-DNA--[protein]-cysteine S-methyltransferase [Betaproteobacteria bacterium]
MVLRTGILPTPLGDMLAVSSDSGLCALEFTGPKRQDKLSARLRRHFPPHDIVDRPSPVIDATRAWLDAYFAGASAEVDGLPLDMHGAPFELRVWRALLEIPAGRTSSYGAIAARIGAPGAARAVGMANGANPIAIIVPCHRVIGSDGSLTGYGGGLDRKTWLLDHERRWRTDTLF